MCPADFFYRHTNEILFDRDEIVILLASLHQQILTIDEIFGRNGTIKGCEFFLV